MREYNCEYNWGISHSISSLTVLPGDSYVVLLVTLLSRYGNRLLNSSPSCWWLLD